ncbi:receptor-type tyrosine-protein phosphatase gamma-like [Dreissena polymorpha]|uniref:receptor-type tyrosine-protein phosphatase gamma-like n=1 Tax=Dreissena polymorpha TaxID=45954 RepID=UPI0022656441|nr:receptor-type tyrosine-protein phosphatase gamma-like [Dreissena polymorpha]
MVSAQSEWSFVFAGIGRTGTYIALDILIHEGEDEEAVEIYGCVLNMRRNRVSMIQTAEQYEFLHRALVHALIFDCAPVAADQLQNYVSKTGQQQREKQLKSFKTKRHYIAAQSPLPGTVVFFLSLAYKEDCPCIVSFQHTHESKDVGMFYQADNQVLS